METGEEHETLRKNKRARLVGDEDEIGETRFLIRQVKYGHAWSVITWSQKKGEFRVSRYQDIKDYPVLIEFLRISTTLLCHSKLFFISGLDCSRSLSPSVRSFNMDDCSFDTEDDCSFDTEDDSSFDMEDYSSFDTVDDRIIWNVHEDVKTPRSSHIAAAVGDYIYVFGSCFSISCDQKAFIPPKEWGERFNIKDNKWDYLPQPPNPLYDLLYEPISYAVYYNCPPFSYAIFDANHFPQLDSYSILRPKVRNYCYANLFDDDADQFPQTIQVDANQTKPSEDFDANQTKTSEDVDANQTLILFPLNCSGFPICVFNCTSNQWLPTMHPNFSAFVDVPIIYPNFPTQDRLAIVDGVLIWHHNQSIYGYDLINQKCLGSLFAIPRAKDSKMFFLHKGDNLFLYFQTMDSEYIIECYKFQVRKRKQGQDFSLFLDRHQQLHTESMKQEDLLDVFLLGEGRELSKGT